MCEDQEPEIVALEELLSRLKLVIIAPPEGALMSEYLELVGLLANIIGTTADTLSRVRCRINQDAREADYAGRG